MVTPAASDTPDNLIRNPLDKPGNGDNLIDSPLDKPEADDKLIENPLDKRRDDSRQQEPRERPKHSPSAGRWRLSSMRRRDGYAS